MQSVLKNIPIEYLSRGQFQPRHTFEQNALIELADSIRAQGVIEPIIVREISENKYEIIAGERRWRASQLAGLTTVPCIVRQYTDAQAAEVTIIENIQREALNPIEEARALLRLIDDFNYTHDGVAKAVGQSRTRITNILRLLQLDARVQRYLVQAQLTEGHGKILAGLSPERQVIVAQQAINEGWSVRQLEQHIQSHRPSDHKPKDINLSRLEKILSDYLGAVVEISSYGDQKSGWLKIKYQNFDVLSGVLQKMGVEEV